MALSQIILVLGLASAAMGFSTFLPKIPNIGTAMGDGNSNVPSPFGTVGVKCQSIGHLKVCGGSPSDSGNPFGQAFYALGPSRSWTSTFCMADSDGDGFTNGKELGDPACVWTEGGMPTNTTGLSHPGFSCSVPTNPHCLASVTTPAANAATTTMPVVTTSGSSSVTSLGVALMLLAGVLTLAF